MGSVGPLVRLVQEALREGLPVGVDGLGQVDDIVLLRVDQGVEAVVQDAAVGDREYRPPEEVVVARYLCGCLRVSVFLSH